MKEYELNDIINNVYNDKSMNSINKYIINMNAFDKAIATNEIMCRIAKNGNWDEKEIDYLNRISIENNEIIRNLATKDPLTGLYNRVELDSAFEKEQSKMSRNNSYVSSMLMIDIDHFGNFNNTYGHIAGDRVLKDLSHLITNHLRDTDITFRYGGEEIISIFPGTNVDDAYIASKKLKDYVSNVPMNFVNKDGLKVCEIITFSGGITDIKYNEHLKDTTERADKLLYLVKENGRNDVRM